MTAPGVTGMRKIKGQPDYRKNMVSLDQYGRQWCFTIEKDSGYPTGQMFTGGWNDPLSTPILYLVMDKGPDGEADWSHIRVDWRPWIRQVEADEAQWTRNFNNIGYTQFGKEFKPDKHKADPWLLQLTGPRPWPSSEALRAAMNGNEALLGKAPLDEEARQLLEYRFTAARPDTLDQEEKEARERFQEHKAALRNQVDDSYADSDAEIITGTGREDYKKFMAQARAAGMSQPEAVLAWKAHKEAVGEMEQAEEKEAPVREE